MGSDIEDRGAVVRVLRGHSDAESAFVVDDYPYGFRLRCKIRYWMEQASKGQYKAHWRMVTQTTNPKRPGEVWNKPKASQYTGYAVLVQYENDHVGQVGVSLYMWTDDWMRFYLTGVWPLMNDAERGRVAFIQSLAERGSKDSWATWSALVQSLPTTEELSYESWLERGIVDHYGRPPSEREFSLALAYVQAGGPVSLSGKWWQLDSAAVVDLD
ncbi:hypothetical protein [Nocardia terpenica]|uniref:Uncharacterized protein n=1 Tax=Nocardia terpenica TaxID=455432 RepID=A0A164K6C5_9NOCA|nr:hypothetical protein [Nocardia terpenica]KZM71082.1 hypothetical protein AWN90_41970 [Nocardia terpenica]NQE89592.1 hypothetical protein [Nocardia terpenica]